MKIAISSDEHCNLVDTLISECEKRGHLVYYHGPGKDERSDDWPDVTAKAVRQVQSKEADEAIVVCYTGTGASIAANKHKGIRAALCVDPETAKGARLWNHANVLALSSRLITPTRANEILDVWFATPVSDDEWNLRQVATLADFENE